MADAPKESPPAAPITSPPPAPVAPATVPTLTPAPTPTPQKPPEWSTLLDAKDVPKLREHVKTATLDSLGTLAKLIIERDRATVDPQVILEMRGRHEVLKNQKEYAENLASLQNRLYLVQLLDIKAPEKVEPSKLDDWVAKPLSWLAEKTKDIPGIGWLTSFAQGLKGREIERALYTVLALPASLGNGLSAIPGVGMMAIPLQWLGKFGERKGLEMDIQDAIAKSALLGENITFAGLSPADLAQWKAFVDKRTKENASIPTLQELTMNYITSSRNAQRQRGNLAAPIQITIGNITNIEEQKKTNEALEKEKQDKLTTERNLKRWQQDIPSITEVTVTKDVKIEATKAGDTWKVAIPEAHVNKDTGAPSGKEAETLVAAMRELGNAEKIIVTTNDPGSGTKKRLTLDLDTKTAVVPAGTVLQRMHNVALTKGGEAIKTIVFGQNEVPMKGLWAKYEAGTLTLGAHAHLAAGVEQLRSLDAYIPANRVNPGDLFEFNGTSWLPERKPAPSATAAVSGTQPSV